MITKTCLFCKKEFQIDESLPGQAEREYCSFKCKHNVKARIHQKIYYHRMKSSPEYQAKKKASFKNWIENNRAHFNDLCREKSRIANEKNRKIWTEKSLCTHCGRERDIEGRKFCEKCLIRFREYGFKSRELVKEKKAIAAFEQARQAIIQPIPLPTQTMQPGVNDGQ